MTASSMRNKKSSERLRLLKGKGWRNKGKRSSSLRTTVMRK